MAGINIDKMVQDINTKQQNLMTSLEGVTDAENGMQVGAMLQMQFDMGIFGQISDAYSNFISKHNDVLGNSIRALGK